MEIRITISLIVAGIMFAIARAKHFNPFYWIIATGLPGLIVLAFMPSAAASGLTDERRRRRAAIGDLIGIILSCVTIAAFFYFLSSRGHSEYSFYSDLRFATSLAATLVGVVAAFRLFPDSKSPWRAMLRISWSLEVFLIVVLSFLTKCLPTDILDNWPLLRNAAIYCMWIAGVARAAMLLVLALRFGATSGECTTTSSTPCRPWGRWFVVVSCVAAGALGGFRQFSGFGSPEELPHFVIQTILDALMLSSVFFLFPNLCPFWRIALRIAWSVAFVSAPLHSLPYITFWGARYYILTLPIIAAALLLVTATITQINHAERQHSEGSRKE